MTHDSLWFESAIAREFAKLKPSPQTVTPTPALALPQTEIRGDAVYLSFHHLNLVLILDQRFYTNTLKSLLKTLTAVLTFKDGRVVVRYTRSGIEYPLERLVIARTKDYWSVRLKREPIQTPQGITADYRASNIVVEKTSEDRAHGQWLTEEAQRNHDKPNRMFQIAGKRVNQIFDANHVSDSLARAENDQAKPIRPKGYGPGQDETEEGSNLWTGTFVRHEDAGEVKDVSDNHNVLFSEE